MSPTATSSLGWAAAILVSPSLLGLLVGMQRLERYVDQPTRGGGPPAGYLRPESSQLPRGQRTGNANR